MKTNWLILGILASLLVFAVAGCKPKETTLSGQVFIVTKGAENFKLGDVEVLLIEKSQVTNYLQKKQPAIESKMTLAQEELEKIKVGHVPDVLLTNADFAKALSKFNELQKNYDKAVSDSETEAESILAKMQSALDQMKTAQTAVLTSLENYPTPADYLEDFSPDISQKTTTDADGKFFLSYPSTKRFAIFAHAQRMVLDKTETYYWLVDAPTGEKPTQIFLSNNNLASVDPDGYFKLKPKDVQQVLTK